MSDQSERIMNLIAIEKDLMDDLKGRRRIFNQVSKQLKNTHDELNELFRKGMPLAQKSSK